MSNYLKSGLTSLCLVTLISTHAWALFGFGDSDTTIAPFVASSSIDNTSVTLAQSAMNLLGQTTTVSKQGSTTDNMDRVSIDGNTALSTLSYDLVAAVQSSSDKSQIINNHLSELQSTISQLTQQSNNYQSQITQSQALINSCTSDKKAADAAVITAINNNDLDTIDSLIQASVTAGQCETKHRITINALSLITKKNNQLITSLNTKASLIEQHKSTIIQYPEIISDPQIIQELSQISSQF